MSSRMWTRREFGRGAIALAGAALTSRSSFASPGPPEHGFCYLGGPDAIHVFRDRGAQSIPVQQVPAAAPAHLLRHPVLPVIYAVHAVDEWDHLPRGAVSAYRFHRLTGRLQLMATQALSLSATFPRHAVLTADASHLFVAAEGGGIYNLLPVAADGTLQPPTFVRKEFGLSENGIAKLAAPNSVALLPDGALLAADSGQETLTSFTVEHGSLAVRDRVRVHRGEGPALLLLSPDGAYAYTQGVMSGQRRRHQVVNGSIQNETELGRTRLWLPATRLPSPAALLQI